MKLRPLAILSAALFSAGAFATSTQVYVEQNIASNAADDGVYSTEAGALIDTSENGQVYIGFDDQGWLAAGYGHQFSLSDDWSIHVYGELGKWETGEEVLVEALVNYQLHDNMSLFSGLGYNRSGQVLENLSDTAINTNQFIAGANVQFAGFSLDYTYTHENSDGTSGYVNLGQESSGYYTQGDYRTNEHEVVLSKQIEDWTPYLKYTHFNTQEGTLYKDGDALRSPVDNDNIWTLGVSYQF
ncbi:hypothetical protein ACPSL3_05110 [Vibrio owensii]|uniref:hypothetical protein n=1 Tax=Vibrio owensii TaxID=696485 RepID=UPI002221198B|nr:hypothetical protein [Vibrio owensii]